MDKVDMAAGQVCVPGGIAAPCAAPASARIEAAIQAAVALGAHLQARGFTGAAFDARRIAVLLEEPKMEVERMEEGERPLTRREVEGCVARVSPALALIRGGRA